MARLEPDDTVVVDAQLRAVREAQCQPALVARVHLAAGRDLGAHGYLEFRRPVGGPHAHITVEAQRLRDDLRRRGRPQQQRQAAERDQHAGGDRQRLPARPSPATLQHPLERNGRSGVHPVVVPGRRLQARTGRAQQSRNELHVAWGFADCSGRVVEAIHGDLYPLKSAPAGAACRRPGTPCRSRREMRALPA